MLIYHITHKDWWARFSERPIFTSPDFEREGFIHCSSRDQVEPTLDRHFANQKGLLLLHISVTLLFAEFKMEAGSNGELFPHVYGVINKDAIVRIDELP